MKNEKVAGWMLVRVDIYTSDEAKKTDIGQSPTLSIQNLTAQFWVWCRQKIIGFFGLCPKKSNWLHHVGLDVPIWEMSSHLLNSISI